MLVKRESSFLISAAVDPGTGPGPGIGPGAGVGADVGAAVGADVGADVGAGVGADVGAIVGAIVVAGAGPDVPSKRITSSIAASPVYDDPLMPTKASFTEEPAYLERPSLYFFHEFPWLPFMLKRTAPFTVSCKEPMDEPYIWYENSM